MLAGRGLAHSLWVVFFAGHTVKSQNGERKGNAGEGGEKACRSYRICALGNRMDIPIINIINLTENRMKHQRMKASGARAVGPGEAAAAVSSPFDLLPGSLLGVIIGKAGLWKGEGQVKIVA